MGRKRHYSRDRRRKRVRYDERGGRGELSNQEGKSNLIKSAISNKKTSMRWGGSVARKGTCILLGRKEY